MKELQELFMDQRITLQNAIKEEEWDKIMNKTSAESSKLEEKEKKKADKQKDKNLFSSTENAINEKFVEKKSLLLAWMHSKLLKKNITALKMHTMTLMSMRLIF